MMTSAALSSDAAGPRRSPPTMPFELPRSLAELPPAVARPVQWKRLKLHLDRLAAGRPEHILESAYSVGDAIGGMLKRPPEMPQACWLYYVNIEAIDATVARVQAGGGRVVLEPHQVPGGSWIAQCLDPQGAMFAMVAPRR